MSPSISVIVLLAIYVYPERMNMDNEQGFGLVEAIFIVVIVGLIGFLGWHTLLSHNAASKPMKRIITTSSVNLGCSKPAKPVRADPTIAADARIAFIADGFSGTWFDQHFYLISSNTSTTTGTDGAGNPIPPATSTRLSYRVCVGDYGVSPAYPLMYDHSDDGKSLSGTFNAPAHAHDINHVISSQEAVQDLTKCGGKLDNNKLPYNTSVHLKSIDNKGAPFPNQMRLYLMGSIPAAKDQTSSPSGASAVKGGRGGIVHTSTANVDLETGQCFVSTQAFGV